jgi:hypothetical protein
MKSECLNNVNHQLKSYETISLAEMDSVRLMDRTDTKYALSFENLAPILTALSDGYRVMSIGETRVFNYRTDYLDTPSLEMFNDHHKGKLNRFKVRKRVYMDSNLSFLEVKFKSNTGRVIKDRIESDLTDKKAFSGFIREHTPYDPENLNLTLINRFNRFTLVDKKVSERVTIDFNLSFADEDHQISLGELVIIEVKQGKTDKNSFIHSVLRSKGIRQSPFSKYCLGLAMLNPPIKANNFKKTILMINKLSHVELSA